MDILKTVQNEEGKIDENKLTTVLEEYKDLGTKNKELIEKVSGFDSQKDDIIKEAKSLAINLKEGGSIDFSSLNTDDNLSDSFKELIGKSGVSQDVANKLIPTLNKFEEEAKEILESEETKSRIKQAEDLKLGISKKTVAFLSKDDYSAIVKLANNKKQVGNAGDNSETVPPMDRATTKEKLDMLTSKSTKTFKEWAEADRLRQSLEKF